jgi:hypothetical protein
MTKQYQITLGKDWTRFVHRTPADVELLGVIARGAQVGALGRRADGSYVQINGDWVTPLNTSRVRHTLGHRRVPPLPVHRQAKPLPAPAPATPVQVTVRKRRTVTLPTLG